MLATRRIAASCRIQQVAPVRTLIGSAVLHGSHDTLN